MKAKKDFIKVYQFKIALNFIEPVVWRKIQVPENYTFWDLHVAIQDSMGWADYHLHEFRMIDPSTGKEVFIGMPDEDTEKELLVDWEKKIADYFSLENKQAKYTYDFGDNWEHAVELEKILLRKKGKKYPACIDGKGACPPEDVGSASGYKDFLEIIRNPKHEEYEGTIEWAGGKFDPDYFDPQDVEFDDPHERLKNVSGEPAELQN